jgi:predicted RNase H-like nuclease (RuvC/YqgF family)
MNFISVRAKTTSQGGNPLKYVEAQAQLKYILSNQKTISISKLNRILQSMNISVNGKNQKDTEIEYLKNEIKKLKGVNK